MKKVTDPGQTSTNRPYPDPHPCLKEYQRHKRYKQKIQTKENILLHNPNCRKKKIVFSKSHFLLEFFICNC